MTYPPVVTVITPTRNRCELLRETVASVQGQSYHHWQMVVIDDESEDDTWAWLTSLHDPRIEVRRLDRHVERSAARNLGLEEARGRYVLFLDDDDLLPEGALAHHVEVMRRRPEVVASVGSRLVFTEDGAELPQGFVSHELVRNVWEDVILGWVAVAGATLFDVAALRAIGGWDETYVIAEDYELWCRVALQGPVVVSPEVVLRYRVHQGQWRSAQHLRLMDAIRSRAVASSAGPERGVGERAMEGRRLMIAAREHASRDQHLRAVGCALRARRAAPGAFRSPLADSVPDVPLVPILRSSVKALVPRRILSLLRRGRREEDEQVDLEALRVRIVGEVDGRWDPAGGAYGSAGRRAVASAKSHSSAGAES